MTHCRNSQGRTVRLSEFPRSRSSTVVNTLSKQTKRKIKIWNQTIKISFNLKNIKWLLKVTHHQYTTSHYYVLSWYWNTAQMITIWKVKNNSKVTSSSDQTPSLLQPPSVTIRYRIPRLDSVSPVLCVESWWLVHDGRCRTSRKAETGVSATDEAATSHDFTAWVLFPCLWG